MNFYVKINHYNILCNDIDIRLKLISPRLGITYELNNRIMSKVKVLIFIGALNCSATIAQQSRSSSSIVE